MKYNDDTDNETIVEGLDLIHEAMTGKIMDEETYSAAVEVTGKTEEEDIVANWDELIPPEEWQENYDLYLEYKNDPITDEARWANMGSAFITLELIRWIASASSSNIITATDISVAVPKVDVAKLIYFNSKGSREQIVMLRDGIAIRSGAACRYLMLGNKTKLSKHERYVAHARIISERSAIRSHIGRYIETSKHIGTLSRRQVDIIADLADSLWFAAETERAITMLSKHLLIIDQCIYASNVHARQKYKIIKDAGMIDVNGCVISNTSILPETGSEFKKAIGKLVTNKLFRIECHMRDVISNTVSPSFPLADTDEIVIATTTHDDILNRFIFSPGKSSTHVATFMEYLENVISDISLTTEDIEQYENVVQDAIDELASAMAAQFTQQIDKMAGSGGKPIPGTISKATAESADIIIGGVDDWESTETSSEAATRITATKDKDKDNANAASADKQNSEGNRNIVSDTGHMESDRTEGLQNDIHWTGPDTTVKLDYYGNEIMLIPKISSLEVSSAISEYRTIIDKHKSYIRATMRYISAILDDETGLFVKDHQKRGKIDPGRINQYWRSDEIFRTFEHTAGDKNYAIALVIDGSGSMSGSPINMATAGAVIIAEALDDLEIPFSTMVYNTSYTSRLNEEHMDIYEVSSDPKQMYTCTPAPPGCFTGSAIIHTLYKPFNEQKMTIADKCKLGFMIKNGAGGCNDDAYAVRFAANMLHRYKDRDNKIMIVLADGYPAGEAGGMWINNTHYNQGDALQEVVRLVIASGIDIIGLGINDCDLSPYYPVSQEIKSVADIPKTLGELLKTSIRKGRKY